MHDVIHYNPTIYLLNICAINRTIVCLFIQYLMNRKKLQPFLHNHVAIYPIILTSLWHHHPNSSINNYRNLGRSEKRVWSSPWASSVSDTPAACPSTAWTKPAGVTSSGTRKKCEPSVRGPWRKLWSTWPPTERRRTFHIVLASSAHSECSRASRSYSDC